MSVHELIGILLEEDAPPAAWALIEASVYLGTRSRRFTASFRDETGKQVWKSTGLTDRQAALALARKWEEEEARRKRAQAPRPRKPTVRVGPGSAERGVGLLTQKEVALLLGISERAVREIERRAFDKIRSHPLLKLVWREWQGREIDEADLVDDCQLSRSEIAALFALARTPEERAVMRKVIAMTHS